MVSIGGLYSNHLWVSISGENGAVPKLMRIGLSFDGMVDLENFPRIILQRLLHIIPYSL